MVRNLRKEGDVWVRILLYIKHKKNRRMKIGSVIYRQTFVPHITTTLSDVVTTTTADAHITSSESKNRFFEII